MATAASSPGCLPVLSISLFTPALVLSSQEVSASCAINALLGSRRGLWFGEFWSCSGVFLRGLAEVMSL